MDRRSLVVGAAALAAVAGTRIPGAQASTAGDGQTSTVAHARQVLELLRVDRGLVDLEAARSRMEERFAVYLSSAPRDPAADDLEEWTRQRAAELTRTDTLDAAFDNPQARTLLAFGFVLSTQHQDIRLPEITQSMPVPAGLVRLEPDFFPELVRQIEIRTRSMPAFGELLDAGEAEVEQSMAKKKPGVFQQLKRLQLVLAVIGGLIIAGEYVGGKL